MLHTGIPLQLPIASRGLDHGSENGVIPVYHSVFDLTIVEWYVGGSKSSETSRISP